MKKLITLLLALTMCLSLCAPALAKWPETAEEANEKDSFSTDMDDYEAAWVKQEYKLYGATWDENFELIADEESFTTKSGYRILGSDSKITFANTGTGDDYYVLLFCTAYTKDEQGRWVAEDSNDPANSLRQDGDFETCAVYENWGHDPNEGSADSWIMELKEGESYTFDAAKLAGWNHEPDPDALYLVEMWQYYPDIVDGHNCWMSTWLFQINDTKAAEIKAAGKTPAEEGNPFTDVPKDAYYHDAVLWAVENGVTKGMTDTTFEPKSTCIRAQVVTFLWRAMGCPEPTTTENPFTDVKEADYFYKAVLWAVENGITQGMTSTTFGPNDTCTSGHVITFLWRACGKPAAENDGASWYSEAVAWAEGQKLLEGTDTTFAPENLAPRGDIVTYLYRALKK